MSALLGMAAVNAGRLNMAMGAVGLSQACLEESIRFCRGDPGPAVARGSGADGGIPSRAVFPCDACEATIPEGTGQIQILLLGKALLGHSALR